MKISELIQLYKMGYTKDEIEALRVAEDTPAQPTQPASAPAQPTQPVVAPAQPTQPAVAPAQPTQPAVAPAQPTQPAQPTHPASAPADPLAVLTAKVDGLVNTFNAMAIRNSSQPQPTNKTDIEILGEFLVPPVNK